MCDKEVDLHLIQRSGITQTRSDTDDTDHLMSSDYDGPEVPAQCPQKVGDGPRTPYERDPPQLGEHFQFDRTLEVRHSFGFDRYTSLSLSTGRSLVDEVGRVDSVVGTLISQVESKG